MPPVEQFPLVPFLVMAKEMVDADLDCRLISATSVETSTRVSRPKIRMPLMPWMRRK
jgi:hypothetical protein